MRFLIVLLFFAGCASPSSETDTSESQSHTDPEGFVSLFDGTTLDGWEGDSTYWRVENGNLVGEITPATLLKRNSFIIWRGGLTGDFELKTDFRVTDKGNSGINYRSEQLQDAPFALQGYQCDIDGGKRYTGSNYEERRRTTLASIGQAVVVNTPEQWPDSLGAYVQQNFWTKAEPVRSLGDPDSLKAGIRDGDWNECHIIAKGGLLQHYINGVLMSEVTDNDTVNGRRKGLLGVQVHTGPPMKIEYRNMRLKTIE